jgi:hypothetical protein
MVKKLYLGVKYIKGLNYICHTIFDIFIEIRNGQKIYLGKKNILKD